MSRVCGCCDHSYGMRDMYSLEPPVCGRCHEEGLDAVVERFGHEDEAMMAASLHDIEEAMATEEKACEPEPERRMRGIMDRITCPSLLSRKVVQLTCQCGRNHKITFEED